MMKVFHIITHIDLGGAERVAINIAKGGATHGTESHVVEVIRGNSIMTESLIKEMKEHGIIVHRAPIPLFFHWHYILEKTLAWLFPFWFVWLWLRYKPDVIHTHTEIPDLGIFASTKLFPFIKPRIVRTIHNTLLWTGMECIGKRVENFMQSHNANVSISSSVQKSYKEKYHADTPIIYNGVEEHEQQPYPDIRQGKTNICFAGRFERQKGIDTLCEVAKSMQDNDMFVFHIFGEGSLQGRVDDLRGMPNVIVNPPLNGLSAYLSSFDYVFMPSLHEGLATLSIEASLAHTPVLANRAPGLTDTLPEEWPLMVENNDIRQWLHLFSDTLSTIDRTSVANAAQQYVRERFSINKMQEEYLKIYNE